MGLESNLHLPKLVHNIHLPEPVMLSAERLERAFVFLSGNLLVLLLFVFVILIQMQYKMVLNYVACCAWVENMY
jgi:hypothetical protein